MAGGGGGFGVTIYGFGFRIWALLYVMVPFWGYYYKAPPILWHTTRGHNFEK